MKKLTRILPSERLAADQSGKLMLGERNFVVDGEPVIRELFPNSLKDLVG